MVCVPKACSAGSQSVVAGSGCAHPAESPLESLPPADHTASSLQAYAVRCLPHFRHASVSMWLSSNMVAAQRRLLASSYQPADLQGAHVWSWPTVGLLPHFIKWYTCRAFMQVCCPLWGPCLPSCWPAGCCFLSAHSTVPHVPLCGTCLMPSCLLQVTESISIPFHEVDAHCTVPTWLASNKRETGARTIRPKIHKHLPEFLTVRQCSALWCSPAA